MTIDAPDQQLDIMALNLRNFLDFEDMKKTVEKTLAFVSIASTLGDAKREMERTEKCQDVFVTQNGKQEEPVLGWLTNIEISRYTRT